MTDNICTEIVMVPWPTCITLEQAFRDYVQEWVIPEGVDVNRMQ